MLPQNTMPGATRHRKRSGKIPVGRTFPCVLTWSCSVCICVLMSSSFKSIGQIGSGPTHMASFYLSSLFKDAISENRHILRVLGVKTSAGEFRENTGPPTTVTFAIVHVIQQCKRPGCALESNAFSLLCTFYSLY